VPFNRENLSKNLEPFIPRIKQIIIDYNEFFNDLDLARSGLIIDKISILISNYIAREYDLEAALCSFSSHAIVYKGMLRPDQFYSAFPDLNNELAVTNKAIFHNRMSTNTNPKFPNAQPFDYIAHNGEFNSNAKNFLELKRNFFTVGEGQREEKLRMSYGASDSWLFNNSLKLLVTRGLTVSEAITIYMPPIVHMNDDTFTDEEKCMLEYFRRCTSEFCGPSNIIFNGRGQFGVKLDNGGFRPARVVVYKDKNGDEKIYSGSEHIIDIEENEIISDDILSQGEMVVFIANGDKYERINSVQAIKNLCKKLNDNSDINLKDF